jgi:hypothetical protein
MAALTACAAALSPTMLPVRPRPDPIDDGVRIMLLTEREHGLVHPENHTLQNK